MLLDTHTHLNYVPDADVKDVAQRAFDADVHLVTVGTHIASSRRAVEVAERFATGVWATVGCHPNHALAEVKDYWPGVAEPQIVAPEGVEMIDQYRELLKSKKVVAIGETGLDYYRLPEGYEVEAARKIQGDLFRAFIRLAKERDLPVTVHLRGEEKNPYAVYDEALEILREEDMHRGNIHCYGGTYEQAKKFVDAGFHIGITGIVTFKSAKALQEMVAQLPLDALLLETDAPFLAPEPHRGKANESSYLPLVATKVAQLRGVSTDAVAEATTANARRLFRI